MTPRKKKTRKTRSRRKSSLISLPALQIKHSTQQEVLGIIYLLVSLVSAYSLLGGAGPLGNAIEGGLTYLFGIAVWLFPVLFFGMGLILILFHRRYQLSTSKNLGLIIIVFSILGLIHLTGGTYPEGTYTLPSYSKATELGGLIGFITGSALFFLFRETASQIILFGFVLIGLILVFDISLHDIVRLFSNRLRLTLGKEVDLPGQSEKLNIITPDGSSNKTTKPKPTSKTSEPDNSETEEKTPKKSTKTSAPKKKGPLVNVRTTSVESSLDLAHESQKYADWEFPPLDLLNDDTSSIVRDDKYLQQKAQQIKSKLEQFGINVTMQDVHLGPTVMQYTLHPAEGIKLSKITTLKNDLALALAAESLRIEAPIPGKSLVGIEVPNQKRATVRLREILTSKEFSKIKGHLKIPLGRAADGTPVIGELSRMPHLLIAGQTGSGKSVAINATLISLLYQNSPADLRLILVDPKRVELNLYNSIPHLLTPVIVEPEKTIAALKWAVAEMTRRYKLCAESSTRNITEYNQANPSERLPYIVIVIDELADLMMLASKEVEALICRIAQMARAVGIHLIIATQRPSVDVITGLIKANIPTRMAFTVASGVDSRTILDSVGAEDLLGMGDMLYLTSEVGKPVRVQGVYIDTEEVQRVTSRLKLTKEPDYITEEIVQEHEEVQVSSTNSTSQSETSFTTTGNETDEELIEKAIQVLRETRKASASLLQRRLSIGYARAARLLDLMEEKGIVGPVQGAKPRDIFLPDEE